MLYNDKKEFATPKANKNRNKAFKVTSLPDIQTDKFLSKSIYTPSKVKDSTDGDFNLALSNTSNSSCYKCDDIMDIRSPSMYENSQILSFHKNSQMGLIKPHISRIDLLSKNNEEKPNLVKIVEELAEAKHLNSKNQNEINILNQKLNSMKKEVYMKNKEIETLNRNHKEIMDKYVQDNQNYQKLYAEFYILQDTLRKQNITFKSSLNLLVEIIDIVLVSPLNMNNKLTLSNNSVLENTVETISYLKNEEKKKKIIQEIKNILINNFSYIKTNMNLDLDEELQKIKNWDIVSSTKPNNLNDGIDNYRYSHCKNNLNLVEENKYNFENIFSSVIELSPKFSQEKDFSWEKEKNCNSLQLMGNFNGSLSDLGIIKNDEENSSEREVKNKELLHFNNFNDTPTEFNNEIIMKDLDIFPHENTQTQDHNKSNKVD